MAKSHRLRRILQECPDLSPAAFFRIAEERDIVMSRAEKERVGWLWARRPPEMNVFGMLLILGIGAIGHFPLVLFSDPWVFIVAHSAYLVVAVILVGRFLWQESRHRKWRHDYRRALARLAR